MASHIERRKFLATLLGGAAAWPLAVRAQQPAMPVVGYLSAGSQESDVLRLTHFRKGLSETGYIEGRDVAIEYRWADGLSERLPALAAELARHRVSVIVAAGTPSALSAKGATSTIPIIFLTAADPVLIGLVASLSRPDANMTGVASLAVELGPKQLELAHELVPTATTIHCRDSNERAAERGPQLWAAAPRPSRKHQTRPRYGLRDLGGAANRRARDQHR